MGKSVGGLLTKGGDSGSMPTPPPTIDPNTIINSNINTNRYNWQTPQGSRTWTTGPDGKPVVTDALNPADQANYEAVQGLNSGFTTMAQNRLNGMNASDPNGTAMMDMLGQALPGSSAGSWSMGGGGGMPSMNLANTQADYSKLPGLTSSLDTSKLDPLNTDFSALTDKAREALYKKTTGLLEPDYANQQRQIENQLANQGLVVGSEAYNDARNRLDSSQNQSRERAALDATINANNEASRLFGMNLQGRQQGVDELMKGAGLASQARGQLAGELDSNMNRNVQGNNLQGQLAAAGMSAGVQARGQDLARLGQADQTELARRSQLMQGNNQQYSQLMQSLMGSRSGVPQLNFGSPGQIDTNGAYGISAGTNNSNYQAQQNNYNSQQQQQQADQQMMMQLAMMLMGSDRRLKEDIEKVGVADNGLNIYKFRYKAGGPVQLGYMSDEVRKIAPHAVHVINGYDFVNYGAI